jgi:hypothetical protein
MDCAARMSPPAAAPGFGCGDTGAPCAARKRPLSPAPTEGARRDRPRGGDSGTHRDWRHGANREDEARAGSVNREDAAGAARAPRSGEDARWWWPPGDACDAAAEPSDDGYDSASELGVPLDVPCCSRWRECAGARGGCLRGARRVRRIHDEDGAAVDVVLTRQFGAQRDGGPAAVAYKTYDVRDNANLTFLVDAEARRAPARCVHGHSRAHALTRSRAAALLAPRAAGAVCAHAGSLPRHRAAGDVPGRA